MYFWGIKVSDVYVGSENISERVSSVPSCSNVFFPCTVVPNYQCDSERGLMCLKHGDSHNIKYELVCFETILSKYPCKANFPPENTHTHNFLFKYNPPPQLKPIGQSGGGDDHNLQMNLFKGARKWKWKGPCYYYRVLIKKGISLEPWCTTRQQEVTFGVRAMLIYKLGSLSLSEQRDGLSQSSREGSHYPCREQEIRIF